MDVQQMGPSQPVLPAPQPDGAPEEKQVLAWEQKIRAVQVRDARQILMQHRWRQQLAGEDHADMVDPTALPDGVQLTPEKAKTNLIFSTFESALPLIYDSVADIQVSPARSVDDTHYELSRMFASTLNVVMKREFVKEAKLKARMRALARSTMAESLGWVKMAYAREYETESFLATRPEDAQDEIARLKSLAERLPEMTDPQERVLAVEELRSLKEALFAQRDVVVREGLVIDLLSPTDVVVSPEVVCINSDYRQAEWVAQCVHLTVQEAAARYKMTEHEARTARQYGQPQGSGMEGEHAMGVPTARTDIDDGGAPADRGPGGMGYVRAWEIWNQRAVQVLTIVEGLKRWARPPMRPERRPARWLPFYNLAFNHVEHRRYPLSDVGLLHPLQDEFQKVRRRYDDHRDASIQKTAMDASEIDATDAKEFNDAPVGALVPLRKGTASQKPLREAFFTPEIAMPDPRVYDTAPIIGDMQRVFGMGDSMRGAVSTPKTATEASITKGATEGRMGERTDEIVSLEEEMAEDAVEILLQELSLERVQQMAGASAVWPQLDRATIFRMVSVSVVHESKAERERKQAVWMEISPQIGAMQMEIAQLRLAGLDMLAEPKIELMRETLKRYDERIDIERFLPGGPLQAGVPLPAELQQAAAAANAPVNAQQLAMLMAIAGQGQQAAPGGPGGPQGGGAGGPQAGPYNPGAGGMGPPQAQGAGQQSGGVT